MKVLHVLATNKYSGAENVVCQIIKMFKGEIEMAYCSPNGDIADSLKERGVRFVPLKKLSVGELRKAIAQYQPDIIHAHDVSASVVSALCFSGKRIISHIHGNDEKMSRYSKKAIVYAAITVFLSQIVFVSKSCLDDFRFKGLVNKKSKILYNIISLEDVIKKSQQQDSNEKFDVVYVGRIGEPKNPIRLVEVLNKVIKKDSKIKCAIIGSGPMFDETKQKIEEVGIENNVKMLGFMSNPFPILSNAKAFIMTSRFEGTPMVALEAQALGIPIVSTPVDGLKDIVINDENGYLSNDDDELANKLLRLVTDNDYQTKLSENSKHFSQEYNNIENYKREIIQCYGESEGK